MTDEAGTGLVEFGERVLSLLDEASYSTTYKHALLLGMVDSLRAGVDGGGTVPNALRVGVVAERVLELYWPQVFPFPTAETPVVLRQSRTKGTRIVGLIEAFKVSHDLAPRTPLTAASLLPAFPDLLREVEWTLANMPLPRLQRPYTPFIYEVDWDEATRRGVYFSGEVRHISFKPSAARNLVVLANLLRPTIQRRWASLVARINRDVLDESILDDFLFEPERGRPRRLLKRLSELQAGRCFYCRQPLGVAHIDHFLAWSLTGDDSIDNYVVACGTCNLDKSASLPASTHVERWVLRLRDADTSNQYAELSAETSWPRRPDRTLGLARSLYLGSAGSKSLWQAPGEYKPLKSERLSIQAALA